MEDKLATQQDMLELKASMATKSDLLQLKHDLTVKMGAMLFATATLTVALVSVVHKFI